MSTGICLNNRRASGFGFQILYRISIKEVCKTPEELGRSCLFSSTRIQHTLFLAILNIETMSNLPQVRWGIIGKSEFIPGDSWTPRLIVDVW